MNKKFSTLLASFLLAGGLFSTADAAKIVDQVGEGYFYLEQVGEYTTSWAEASGKAADGQNWVISYNPTLKKFVFSTREDGNYANYWKVVEKEINGIKYYQLVTASGKTLSVKLGEDTIDSFSIPSAILNEGDVNGISFTKDGKTYFLTAGAALNGGKEYEIDVVEGASGGRGFDFIYAPGTDIKAETLNKINGANAGFNLSIGKMNTKGKFAAYSDLQGNVFAGTLKAEAEDIKFTLDEKKASNVDYKDQVGDVVDGAYALKSGSNYLVLLNATWSQYNVTAGFGLGNKFALMSKDALLLQLAKDDAQTDASKKVIKSFSFIISENVNDDPYLEVQVVDANSAIGEVFVADFNGAQYLTIHEIKTAKDADYNINAEGGHTYVKLGGGNLVDWTKFATSKAYYTIVLAENILNDDDEVVTPKGYVYGSEGCATYSPALLAPTRVQLTMPEGMWAFQYNGGSPIFVNRESGVKLNASEVAVYDLGNNVYQNASGDKFTIVAHAVAGLAAGYGEFATAETEYNIGIYSPVWGGVAYFAENHEDSHVVGLDPNVENASVWTLSANKNARTYNKVDGAVKTETDSIYVINTLSYYAIPAGKTDKEWINVQDTMRILSYKLINAYGEYFNGEACSTTLSVRVIFKKVGNYYNMIGVEYADVNNGIYHYGLGNLKLYGGDSATNGLVAWTCMYERTENDLVAVEALAAPTYRRLVNALDTVSIYRDENASQLLYEETTEYANFLNLKNENQFEIAPAMVAELVASEDNKPMYLLSVGTTVVPEGKWCATHETSDCEHATATKGYTEGRFLVSLVDSTKAWKDDHKHAVGNPYTNEEGAQKLGFVQATHRNDSLVWANPTIEDVTGLKFGDKKMNIATFAFRYVDEEAGSFKIETKDGFLKWMNGVVIITNEAEADVFNMNEEEDRTPTANEEIAAEGVTVIAGNGNVTIAGAAGKKVVIANILGQTIANTVLTSDNATIAAPAGVVVVKVEGEAAVKAIVK